MEAGKAFFACSQGNWHEEYFNNRHPIHLELACGRGEYSLGMARLFPFQNFIGIDIKGDRLWKGATQADREDLPNVAFLRCRMHEIDRFFAPQEVSGIRMVFPDPRPRSRDMRRRLTHPRYLDMYRRLLQPQAWFRLKTDSDLFFEYSLQSLAEIGVSDLSYTYDLYRSPWTCEHYGIQTRYERMWLAEGRKIKYLKCRFISTHPVSS